MQNINYKNYEKLIKKISWSWHKTTGEELEVLIAEANLAYIQCLPKYNPNKSKFSTFLWKIIQSHFKNIFTRQSQERFNIKGRSISLEKINLSTPATQEKNTIFKNSIACLSKEAKEIISIVLDSPADLIAMLPKSKITKHQLQKYLCSKGWEILIIHNVFDEIKKAL